MRHFITISLSLIISFSTYSQELYTQSGTDSTWEHIISNQLIPIGEKSIDGITGSTIDVNNELVETGIYADNPIINNLCELRVGIS
ncbi:MAG: hypothetical protein GY827_03435 [Cytophagales bacterium]|nr:hypothetical protein [Cytophagales bacterium]